MKRLFVATTALVASATVAHAGGLAAPTIEAPVAAPAAVVVAAPAPVSDWAGAYVGGSLTYGYGEGDYNNATEDADGVGASLRAGYDWQFGSWLLGLGGEYTFTGYDGTIAGNDVKLDDTKTVFARVGYALDTWLPYASLGYNWASAEANGVSYDVEGASYGLGVEKLFTPNLAGFAEYNYYDADDIGSVTDLSGQALKLGVNYRF